MIYKVFFYIINLGDNMDKERYKNLDIYEKLEYINKMLKEGYSQTKLEPIIGISRRTMSKQFNEIGYEYNKVTKQFESIIEVIEDNSALDEICVTAEITEEKQESSNLVVRGEQVNYKVLEELILNYKDMNNKLNEVYKWYQNSSKEVVIEDKKLVIEDFEGKLVSRSFKLYEPIQKEFTEFCKVNNKYKVQDLISQALKNFMNQYK